MNDELLSPINYSDLLVHLPAGILESDLPVSLSGALASRPRGLPSLYSRSHAQHVVELISASDPR